MAFLHIRPCPAEPKKVAITARAESSPEASNASKPAFCAAWIGSKWRRKTSVNNSCLPLQLRLSEARLVPARAAMARMVQRS
jgi:hypothetical protein